MDFNAELETLPTDAPPAALSALFDMAPLENRRANSNWGLQWAAKNGNIPVLEWLVSQFDLCSGARRPTIEWNLGMYQVEHCAQADVIWALRWATAHVPTLRWLANRANMLAARARADIGQAAIKAAKEGHLAGLKFLVEEFRLTTDDVRTRDKDALSEAACTGQQAVVEYLVDRFALTKEDVGFENYRAVRAATNSSLALTKWFVEQFAIAPTEIELLPRNARLQRALHRGDQEMAKYLVEVFDAPVTLVCLADAARIGLSLVKWVLSELYPNPDPTDGDLALRYALDGGLPVVEFVVEWFGLNDISRETLREASLKKNFSLLKYVVEFFGVTAEMVRANNNEILKWVVLDGELQMIEYLMDRFNLRGADLRECRAVSGLAVRGHLPVIKHLVRQFGEEFVRNEARPFLHTSAEYGHFDVVEYLADLCGWTGEDERANNYQVTANAIKHRNLNAVRWAINRAELTPVDIRANSGRFLFLAAISGCARMLKYLVDTFELTAEDARAQHNKILRWAAAQGHVDVVNYLMLDLGLNAADARDALESHVDAWQIYRRTDYSGDYVYCRVERGPELLEPWTIGGPKRCA